MWIEEKKNGKFKAVERYEDYLTGKQKKVSITIEKNTAQSRKLAQAALNEKIKQLTVMFAAQERKITLGELVEEYRKFQKLTVAESTYTRNFFACNTFLRLFGADTLVERLNAKIIRDVLLGTGRDFGTLNGYLERLRALLRWGYKSDLISDVSYLAKLENFAEEPHRTKIEDKYLEQEEVALLLSKMTVPKWKQLTRFLILTGMRVGEALALSPKDIDLNNRLIHIDKNYDSVNDILKMSPKNSPSIRDIYIQDELLPFCKDQKRTALAYRLVTGHDVFFQDSEGRYEYYAYNKYLKENTAKYIGRELTTHAMRHTHVSLLAEQGVELEVISRRLGHANSKITREIYFHVTKKLRERDYQRVAGIKLL